MGKRILFSFIFLVIAFTAFTFLTNPGSTAVEKKKEATPVIKDSTDQNKEDTFATIPAIRANDTLTDLANFIAGIRSFKTHYLGDLSKDSSWMKYAGNIEKTWKKLDTIRYHNMENWADAQLKPLSNGHYNLFYPFSGPDFLNADLFFPDADTITMIGLEPVGTLPDVSKESFRDSLGNYVGSLRKSLTNVLNWSFFITKHMFSDLRAHELNGTTHLLLWFAARRQYNIARVRPIAITYNGSTAYAKDTAYHPSRIKGTEIICVKENRTKVIRYFSADLSNYGFRKNPRLEKFLRAQHFTTTLVKSASYLMHSSNFSVVRNYILDQTEHLLQDDTGIPYRFLAKNHWGVTLYGEYERPIRIFDQNYQDDLKRAYDSLEIKSLPFGIGYKYRKNESTWILASKEKSMAKL